MKRIRVSPVRIYEEEREICYEKCNSDFADKWSVYVQASEGEFCIADCKNESIALKFKELIRNLIRNDADLL
jgi:hypothetical protein